jgi:hypothetical protein
VTDLASDLAGLFAAARSTAWRFEQQARYASDFHPGHFERWLAGDPVTPPPGHSQWRQVVRGLVDRGVQVTRVRIHEDPPTEVNRWARFKGRWNSMAGEEMRYARRADTPPDLLGPTDWWLVDGAVLLVMAFDHDGAMIDHRITSDPAVVAAARDAWPTLLRVSEIDRDVAADAP